MDDPKLLRDMCAVLKHRGPDEEGTFIGSRVGLGSRRLSIIDLPGGKQPISNEDGTIWTVFNGEIYNYLELKSLLERLGHFFKTDSDTEVIVHGYEEWGTDCLRSFVGMFGLALWDDAEKRLILARDRFGKKPLYYWLGDGALIFSSEMKGVLQHEGVSRRIDAEALEDYLTFFYIPSPLTIFSGLRKLGPGEFLTFQEGRARTQSYWDLTFNASGGLSEGALVDELYRLFEDSVRVRLRSDVPLGAFLSGGIDSSAVVAMMKRLSDDEVSTFTVDFEEGPYSEARWAGSVAELLGTKHEVLTVKPDALTLLPRLVWHFDEPFADSSMIPTYYVAEATVRKVKVALSGDGGDEVFMGYPWMEDPSFYKYYKAVPSSVMKPVLRVISSVPVRNDLVTLAKHALDKQYANQGAEERYFLRASQIGQKQVDDLLGKTEEKSRESAGMKYLSQYFEREKSGDLLNAFDYVTIKTYLPEDILVKVDRMSMAVSLEVRSPFLDHRLAEFAASLPSGMKVHKSVRKYLLKKMALTKGLLPKSIVSRKKHGFGVPIDYWFHRGFDALGVQIIERAFTEGDFESVVRKSAVDEIMRRPFANASKIFALMTLAIWYQMYVVRREAVPSFDIKTYS
jgi:asparagine synthase (glutamine-hydrolysing)